MKFIYLNFIFAYSLFILSQNTQATILTDGDYSQFKINVISKLNSCQYENPSSNQVSPTLSNPCKNPSLDNFLYEFEALTDGDDLSLSGNQIQDLSADLVRTFNRSNSRTQSNIDIFFKSITEYIIDNQIIIEPTVVQNLIHEFEKNKMISRNLFQNLQNTAVHSTSTRPASCQAAEFIQFLNTQVITQIFNQSKFEFTQPKFSRQTWYRDTQDCLWHINFISQNFSSQKTHQKTCKVVITLQEQSSDRNQQIEIYKFPSVIVFDLQNKINLSFADFIKQMQGLLN